MRTGAIRRCSLWAAVLLSGAAAAQELGLDLTEEGPELRPSIAFLGVTAAPERAEQAVALSQVVENLVRGSNGFVRVVSPGELQALLGDGLADALACEAAECFTALSHQLAMDRLLRVELGEGGLTLWGFDWGQGEVQRETVALPVARTARAMEKALAPKLAPVLRTLSVPVGNLVVKTNAPAAEIRWGGRLLGSGEEVKSVVPAGTQTLEVRAPDFVPAERSVSVQSGQTTTEEVTLERPVVEAAPELAQSDVQQEVPAGPAIDWNRPSVYLAAAGVAALAVGLGLGASANSVASRMRDDNGDGALDVTRAEVLGAQRTATAANVLAAAGLLMVGGGGAWFFIDQNAEGAAGGGAGVYVHGSF